MRIMAFINSFLSYLLVFFVFCIVGGFGIFMGITLRKRKNTKEENQSKEAEADTITMDTWQQALKKD